MSQLHNFRLYPLVVQLNQLNFAAKNVGNGADSARQILEMTALALEQYSTTANYESKLWIPADDERGTLYDMVSKLVDSIVQRLDPNFGLPPAELNANFNGIGSMLDNTKSVDPKIIMPEYDFNDNPASNQNVFPSKIKMNHASPHLALKTQSLQTCYLGKKQSPESCIIVARNQNRHDREPITQRIAQE